MLAKCCEEEISFILFRISLTKVRINEGNGVGQMQIRLHIQLVTNVHYNQTFGYT